jgi:tRNA A-37 threonylcarbamoyl transferase component Bud32/tetratricopeptide (TPR) repeat protein
VSALGDRLQTALQGRYRLERELGSGGMAIVWLAEDVKHRRRVAIKVLRPELAASIGPARFVREIEIAAGLQHPHILPLLDSGEADGLAYYVMPYVEGESLRERVQREGALPPAEAVALVREVADALAYAHRRGVVHRDVKPDNVMLAEGHALVMDFGVAKAVSDARSESMTTVGMAIGTPAYMAPEQAAGDPNVDYRADLYALGCLAYELLGGRPPFTGATPQAVLAAHLTKAPPPLDQVRPGLPAGVTGAVMRCLAKQPGDRWSSAGEFRAALDVAPTTPMHTQAIPAPSRWYGHPLRTAAQYALVAAAVLGLTYFLVVQAGLPDWVLRAAIALLVAGLPVLVATGLVERRRAVARATGVFRASAETGLGRHVSWRRAATGGGIAFGALLLAAGVYQALGARGIGPGASLVGQGRLAARDRIVVGDFQNRTADSTLGATLTEAFRIDLSQTPLVQVLTTTQLQAGLARMGRASGAALDTATAHELAVREGAKAYVVGEVSAVGASYALAARLLAAEDGAELVAVRSRAAGDGELLAAVDELSAQLRERMGESLRTIRAGEPLEQVTTSSLEALRLYGLAEAASSRTDNETAVRLLRQAVTIDTGFAMAWRKLAAVYGNMRAPMSQRVDAATRAFRFRDRLPPLERAQATAFYYYSVDAQLDSAEAAFRAVLERNPDDVTALNNLSILLNRLARPAEAEPLLRHGLAVDSGVASLYQNLASVQATLGRPADAHATIAAFERRIPAARDNAQFARVMLLASERRLDTAQAVARAAMADTKDPAWRLDLMSARAAISTTQGRLGEALRLADSSVALARAINRRRSDQFDNATFGAAIALVHREDTAAAVRIIEDAMRRYPLREGPVLDRPYLRVVDLAMMTGRFGDARAALAEWRDSTPPGGGAEGWARRLEAELDVRERGDRAALARLVQAADSAPCRSCNALWMGKLFDDLGMEDSARAWYARGADGPLEDDHIWEDGWSLPRALKRLGEIYERQGNRPKALAYYQRFVELWRNADPELQPTVREVRERMADLAGEPR